MTGSPLTVAERSKALQDVLARARTDPEYRRRLVDDPRTVLRDAGVVLPADLDLRPLDAADGAMYLVLPCPNLEGEVPDAELERASGGTLEGLWFPGTLSVF